MRKEVKEDQGYLVSISTHVLTRYNGGGEPLKILEMERNGMFRWMN